VFFVVVDVVFVFFVAVLRLWVSWNVGCVFVVVVVCFCVGFCLVLVVVMCCIGDCEGCVECVSE